MFSIDLIDPDSTQPNAILYWYVIYMKLIIDAVNFFSCNHLVNIAGEHLIYTVIGQIMQTARILERDLSCQTE